MSKHVLNTIILISLLIIILIGGIFAINRIFGPKISEAEEKLQEKEKEHQRLKNFEVEVANMNQRIEQKRHQLNNFPVMFIDKDFVNQAFLYFERFDRYGEFFKFNYQINDITDKEEYTEATYSLSGEGPFLKLEDFINYLEYSPPAFYIDNFSCSYDKNSKENSIKLLIRGVFIDKAGKSGRNIFSIQPRKDYPNKYNPFRPLILWNLPPNDENLVDIRDSKLISLVKPDIAWLKLKHGQLKQLEIGDRVYLGKLESIDIDKGTATFRMNMGGILQMLVKSLNEKVANVQ